MRFLGVNMEFTILHFFCPNLCNLSVLLEAMSVTNMSKRKSNSFTNTVFRPAISQPDSMPHKVTQRHYKNASKMRGDCRGAGALGRPAKPLQKRGNKCRDFCLLRSHVIRSSKIDKKCIHPQKFIRFRLRRRNVHRSDAPSHCNICSQTLVFLQIVQKSLFINRSHLISLFWVVLVFVCGTADVHVLIGCQIPSLRFFYC